MAKDEVKDQLDDLEPENGDAIKGGGLPTVDENTIDQARRSTARKLPEGTLRDTVRPQS